MVEVRVKREDELQGDGKKLFKYLQRLPSPGSYPGIPFFFFPLWVADWKKSHRWGELGDTAALKSADIKFHLNTGCISLQIVLGTATPVPLPQELITWKIPKKHGL